MSAPNVDDTDTVTGYLDDLAIDSNYSATYWPWIQVRDTDNATQLYLPPTGEVLKNIALTDNVSYPWFAVAGYSRGLIIAIKAKKKLTLKFIQFTEKQITFKFPKRKMKSLFKTIFIKLFNAFSSTVCKCRCSEHLSKTWGAS